MARVNSQRSLNKLLSKDDKVQAALKGAANRLALKANANLAPHRKTGDHHIEVERIKNEKYGHIDWFVSMMGFAPMSVEFGHKHNRSGQWVQGLYIITRLL